MGKSIKGKECGKGIFQRKDGWYIARFVDKCGTRHEKYFKTIPEARNWQTGSQYQDRHGSIVVPVNITVDIWFNYWVQNIVGVLVPKPKTLANKGFFEGEGDKMKLGIETRCPDFISQ